MSMSVSLATANDTALLTEVTQFVYKEARLQDDHEYSEWEALWADDGVYWIPANGEGTDPNKEMSIVHDNRSRIALRVKQLYTGKRYSQTPRSRLRRLVSNIELLGEKDGLISVQANAILFESSLRGDTIWASKNQYGLRREAGQLRMVLKKVVLVNNDTALYTMAFLI